MDLASAEAKIRHVFGDTLITEASIGAAPPDILVKLSGCVLLSSSELYIYGRLTPAIDIYTSGLPARL